MATYTKLTNAVPSAQRIVKITDVSAGDRIDLVDALGRAARKVRFFLTADTDEINVKFNNLLRLTKRNGPDATPSTVEVWSGGSHASEFTYTGSTIIDTLDDFKISSLEIGSLTLGTGTTIEIVAF